MKTTHAISAILLVACAGLPLMAQDTTTTKTTRQTEVRTTTSNNWQPTFRSADALRGKNLHNSATKDTVGSIDELIIDRGSGQIAFAVVKTGTTLGLGGKQVVIPFAQLSFPTDDDNPTIAYTEDQMKTWPEFDLKNWKKTDRSVASLPATLANDYYRSTPSSVTPDRNAKSQTVRGKITSFSREGDGSSPEHLVATVATDDGQTKQVVLGPSWYLSGNDMTLYRDRDVMIETVSVSEGGQQKLYARQVTIDNRPMPLYGEQGWPTWTERDRDMNRNRDTNNRDQDKTNTRGGSDGSRGGADAGDPDRRGIQDGGKTPDNTDKNREPNRGGADAANPDRTDKQGGNQDRTRDPNRTTDATKPHDASNPNHRDPNHDDRRDAMHYENMGSPFILSNEIDGKNVAARGEKCGTVNDLIVDTYSGRVAFLSIDPDANVLGLGDTKRLVPWTVVMGVGKDLVTLDSSKAMITASPKTPGDLKQLGTADAYRGVYTAYEVQSPNYQRSRMYNDNNKR